jgi:hypothetical protein
MSSSTGWGLACAWFVAVFGAACATGGSSNGGEPADAAVVHHDAQHVTGDAPKGDARPADAFVAVDAPPADSGLFCTANNQCTNAGECCVTLGGPSGFCAPGSVVFGQCVPQ